MSRSAVRRMMGRIAAGVIPKGMLPDHRIAFIHIPKCAGTGMAQALRETYLPPARKFYGRWVTRSAYQAVVINAEASAATAHALNMNLQEVRTALLSYQLSIGSVAYVTGHVPFSEAIARQYAQRWNFVTVLREPVDRFFSEYLYNRYKPIDHFRVESDIHAYLESPDARRTATQLINFLTARPDVHATPDPRDVDTAVQNLKHFAVVGFVGDLDRFGSDLERRFGKRPTVKYEPVNKSPAPPEARKMRQDPEIRRKIERLCEADIEVYQRAWAAHLEAHGEPAHKDLTHHAA